MDTSILTNAGVDINHGLELLGDMDTYNEILQDFLTESATRVPKMKEFLEAGDLVNYEVLVHAQKSDSKYLGFMTLADVSYQHELAAKENNIDFIKNDFNHLMEETNKILTVAKQYIGE